MTELNSVTLPAGSRLVPRWHLARMMADGAAVLLLLFGLAFACAQAFAQSRQGDYILAVVNQELVTAAELDQRMSLARANAAGATLPPLSQLRQQALDSLINERVLLSHARNNGPKVDEAEVDRAVANVALQNQITADQLRQRLRSEGIDYARFRNNVRDQIAVERTREREVQGRVRISDADVQAWLEKKRNELKNQTSYDIAHILVRVPEGASAQALAQQRARAEQAQARLDAGEPFAEVAKQFSDDADTRDKGGRLGARTADRLPDLFVNAVRDLQVGQRAPELVQSPAGFHLLKLIERSDTTGFAVTQTHARHILLRLSPQLSREVAAQRLLDFKRQVVSGRKSFEKLAEENSEDGSAAQGGELGWASPGSFVPEFEEAMNALPLGGVSDPVVSRFGVHLIQVLERRNQALDIKQQRELARSALREQKFEEAYIEWLQDLRARAYIEIREAPQ